MKLRLPHFPLTSKKRTFAQRLRDQALFWGIPILCLELIGLPIRGISLVESLEMLGLVLLILAPATMLGVLVGALVETGLVRSV